MKSEKEKENVEFDKTMRAMIVKMNGLRREVKALSEGVGVVELEEVLDIDVIMDFVMCAEEKWVMETNDIVLYDDVVKKYWGLLEW